MGEGILLRELYLIRHGESRGNAGFEADNIADSSDPVLTENGISQAERLGIYMRDRFDFDAIYSSGMRRAVQTAEGLRKYQKNPLRTGIIPELCEIGISSDYEGQSLDNLSALSPEAYIPDEYKDFKKLVVGDESPKDNEERYFDRAKRVLDFIDKNHKNGEKIALVSHAGFLTYIIFYIIGYRDKEPLYDFKLDNTSVTKIVFYEPGTYPYGDVVFDGVNMRNHLDG